jgi:uncharacterized protein (DUF849 family)
LILGNIACAQADLMHLGLMRRELPDGALWAGGGIGEFQLKVNAMALLEGGGVRVGLEDSLWFDAARTQRATNRDLLERILLVAQTLGLTPYSHREAREVLGAGCH